MKKMKTRLWLNQETSQIQIKGKATVTVENFQP